MNIINDIETLQYAQYVYENGYEKIALELIKNVANKLLLKGDVDDKNSDDSGEVQGG